MCTFALLRSRPRKQMAAWSENVRKSRHTDSNPRDGNRCCKLDNIRRDRGNGSSMLSASNCRCLVDPSAWKQLAEPSATPFSPSAAHAGGEIGTTVDRWEGGSVDCWKTSVVRNIQNAQTPLLLLGGGWNLPTTTPQTRQIGRFGLWSGMSATGGGCEAQVSRLVLMPGGLRLRPGAHRLPPPLESATVREPHEVPHGMRSRVGPKCGRGGQSCIGAVTISPLLVCATLARPPIDSAKPSLPSFQSRS